MLGQLSKPKKLCLLRLSAIGDVCHAVAMVQTIQRHWPETQITWVIGKIEASLLQDLPGVKFVIFDKRAGLQGYRDLYKNLQDEKFDVLLHMQVAFRASLASLCIRAKIKIGFDKQRAKELQHLFTNRKIAPQENPHVLEGFMGFAQALGVDIDPKNCTPQWQMPLSEAQHTWLEETLKTNEMNNQAFVVICPAASKAERNWHVEGYAGACDYLLEKGINVVIAGGPTTLEKQLAHDIILNSKVHQNGIQSTSTGVIQHKIVDLVAKTSLKQLLALLKRAQFVIAPDTGPAHMAVTVNTPVIGLYAHSNPYRTGPYLYPQYTVSCYQQSIIDQYGKTVAELPWGKRAKGEHLMSQITLEDVKQVIDKVLNDHPMV